MSSAKDTTSRDESTDEDDADRRKRALTRKLDRRLLPFLSVIYVISYLIRSNISNAKLAGLEEDLHLTSSEYQWALSIFFFGYVIFEVPSNIVLRRWQPSKWLAIMHLFIGTVAMCTGAVKNAGGLLACRFLLGSVEAGLFPGMIYYTSLWYRKKQQAIRLGVFWSFSALAGAFGGILAFAISQMTSTSLEPWRWIFVIEGAPTILLAVGCWFLLPDSPEKATFLTDEERQLEIDRLAEDSGPAKKDSFSWAQVLSVFTDWKTYFYAIIYITGTIGLQGITLSLPVIIKDLGQWTPIQVQLLTIPPYMAAFVAVLVVSRSSDYFIERSYHCLVSNLMSLCGFLMLMFVKENLAARYAGVILAAMGTFANVSVKIAWFNSNFASLTRRAIAAAVIVSVGTSGGAISGQIYRSEDKPRYFLGHTIAFSCMVAQSILIVLLRFLLMFVNRRRDRMKSDEKDQQIERYGGDDSAGDRHPDFRYTL